MTCDDEVEGLETFDMTLTLTSSSSRATLGRNTCEGQIRDSTGKWYSNSYFIKSTCGWLYIVKLIYFIPSIYATFFGDSYE